MKVLIPLAGKGTRLRPHTHTKAKPLIHVAGTPIIAHILDQMIKQIKNVEEVIFITGHLGHQIEDYVNSNYGFKAKFIEQKELKGQAHAVQLAKNYVKSDVLIWFVDTISDANLEVLARTEGDGVLFVKEVDDPKRFGIVITDNNGFVAELEEKPQNPRSNLVNIGLYYVKNSKMMFECIDKLIKRGMQTKGEYYLMDAFQLMIDKGIKFKAEVVSMWEDCGKPETLLKTNRYFLDHGSHREIKSSNSVIIPPVYMEDTVKVENSVIGPYVSIAKNAIIRNSIVRDSIINEHSAVEDAKLKSSIVGEYAIVKGASKRLNVGDNSEVVFG